MPADEATAYGRARRDTQRALRTGLLDVASGLLVAEGPGALTMRRIAAAAGCSTTVLYTLFGGKEGLAEALYLEGFERLRRRLEAVPRGDDPLERLRAIGRAYRENALAERNYYGVMFEQAIPGYTPSEQARAAGRRSLEVMRRVVAECLEAGLLGGAGAEEIAEVLWAAAHGAVGLELAGHFPPEVAESRFHALLAAAGAAYRRG
ncbi:TetR/AcrR family transcriptional regulator [Streptomyces capparidis]